MTVGRLNGVRFPRLSVLGVFEIPAGDFALSVQRLGAFRPETANESRVLLLSFIFVDSVPARSNSGGERLFVAPLKADGVSAGFPARGQRPQLVARDD